VAIDNMLKKKVGAGAPDAPTVEALKQYLVLLRKAEMDRQNWIKIERGVGNTANLQGSSSGQASTTRSRFRQGVLACTNK
jgi:hypothetical protein